MNKPSLPFTLRQWRQQMTRPNAIVALLAVSGVVAIAGPFETASVLTLIPRFFYWLVIVVTSYSCGFIIDGWLRPRLSRFSVWLGLTAVGVLTGLCVVCIVLGLNVALFGILPDRSEVVLFVAPVIVISLIVSVTIDVLNRPDPGASAPALPRILDRLPLDKRGALVALSVEDHYVRVQTMKGAQMVLMRLSDAMDLVGETSGTQVHRSHWVAFDQVTAARRDKDRAILTMSNGAEIPVSRANVAKIKKAGLLPV